MDYPDSGEPGSVTFVDLPDRPIPGHSVSPNAPNRQADPGSDTQGLSRNDRNHCLTSVKDLVTASIPSGIQGFRRESHC